MDKIAPAAQGPGLTGAVGLLHIAVLGQVLHKLHAVISDLDCPVSTGLHKAKEIESLKTMHLFITS